MKQQIASKDVINSLQSIVIQLENRRLNSLDTKKIHHHNRHYSFMHFFEGESYGFLHSIALIKIYLDRLITEK